MHRKLLWADIYFMANTDNRPHAFDATFRGSLTNAEWWDPFTGEITRAGTGSTIHFNLAPYESRILVDIHGRPQAREPMVRPQLLRRSI